MQSLGLVCFFFSSSTEFCGPLLPSKFSFNPSDLWPSDANCLFQLPLNLPQTHQSVFSVVLPFSFFVLFRLSLFILAFFLYSSFNISTLPLSNRFRKFFFVCPYDTPCLSSWVLISNFLILFDGTSLSLSKNINFLWVIDQACCPIAWDFWRV